MQKKEDYKYTKDINGYKAAVWDFLLEHSEITHSGNIFIKFHCDGKRNFENRVLGRWKHNYHREDVQSKAQKIEDQKLLHKQEQKEKKAKYKAEKRARIEAHKKKNKQGILKKIITKLKR